MDSLNIVELIENNPITKLSTDYNVKLLTKIKSNFTEFEQHLFLTSFYCYLNYHPTNDFVIDLDDVWKWLDFSQKQRAKELLEKNFVIEKDYKCLLAHDSEKKPRRGGHNINKYFLNVKTFKSFCLKAGTKKADEIHEYYMKLEEIIQDTIQEETNDLKQQLELKNLQLENVDKDKELLKEKTILEQFPLNTQCIYIGKINNKTLGNPSSKMYQETVIKFGQSNNLRERVKCHKTTYDNFVLYAAFKVKNKIEIENCIKKHPLLQKRIRSITINDISHREILALDDENYALEKMSEYFKDIIKENEYNIDNYNLILDKNKNLEEEIIQLKNTIQENNLKINKLEHNLNKHSTDITVNNQVKITNNYALCKAGYFLYIFECEPMRYKCAITRQTDIEGLTKNLKHLHPAGTMKYYVKILYPFSEKIMMFLLKQSMTFLEKNFLEGLYDDVKKAVDITVKLETLLIDNSKNLDNLFTILEGNTIYVQHCNEVNPEVPIVRKAKRSIDKISKDTGKVIETFESIEAAGRSLNLISGTAIGIAVRENRVCQGFLWRYSNISKEDQYTNQPVVKVCCSTGEKVHFDTIAAAAKDTNVSAPALRNRILTDVHVNNYHWKFDKNSTHYK
jgi:hypothetical protein